MIVLTFEPRGVHINCMQMGVKFKLQVTTNGGRQAGTVADSVSCCCWGHCCCQLLLLLQPNTTLTNVNPLRRCQWPNTSQQSPAELPQIPFFPCVPLPALAAAATAY